MQFKNFACCYVKVLAFLSFFTHAVINGARKLVMSVVNLFYLQFGFRSKSSILLLFNMCCFAMSLEFMV